MSACSRSARRGVAIRMPSSASCPPLSGFGAARHEIGARLGLREGDHLADVLLAGEEGDEAVKPEGKAAVRGRAVPEGTEQEAEPCLGLLVGDPEGAKTWRWISARWIRMLPDPSSHR